MSTIKTIEELEPKEFYKYFKEISAIPRGSRNTKGISDYCVSFAKAHNLEYMQDASNNVIIIKEASAGYENVPAVIIQGHLDMVCEKELDYEIDFEKEGLTLELHDNFLSAKGTTLGADDGVAVAYSLALLADEKLAHPRLEIVLTTDEEIGLLGASAIDLSSLKGKYLINIDSDVEGMFLTSCAGGMTSECELPVEYHEETMTKYTVKVTGLQGGHSGAEIDKYRGNSNKLMGRFLYYLGNVLHYGVISLNGGSKDNAIPRETVAELFIEEKDCTLLEETVAEFDKILKNEFATNDPGAAMAAKKDGVATADMLTPKSKEFVQFMLMNLPNGVQNMSSDIKGLVQTSLNMGILTLDKEKCKMTFSVRSSVNSEKQALSSQLQYITEFLGGEYSVNGEYPAWPYKKDSKLRDYMAGKYEEQFGVKPQIEAIHAGLECGLFCEKIEGLDAISLGPEVFDIHTPKERMNVQSVERYWTFLRKVVTEFGQM
ncbi:aminoacyl-histidine dipeptidase [Konateibacter massiliensis]|uniref:aminoacyl-histidine dipeptidase n=1 Tax=Konateibacter massiliensis TaxID=2002841 RepID=UPI000C1468F5|nr:aminoacyl-histidine dipeptidase [Konateibacter massiliensis]